MSINLILADNTVSVYQNPKLVIPNNNDNFSKAFNKVLQNEIGYRIITDALNGANKITIIFDNSIKNCVYYEKNKTYKISLNDKILYYLTEAKKDELPENFRKYFENSKLKKVAQQLTLDAVLVHEFCHIINRNKDPEHLEKMNTASSSKDMDNKEEERTIAVENSYHLALNQPSRVDHFSCSYPSFEKLEERSIHVFFHYLMTGSQVDILNLANNFSKKELEINLFSLQEFFWKNEKTSENFLDILFVLIVEKHLEIDFSQEKWKNLYKFCLWNINTKEQFKILQMFKSNVEIKIDYSEEQLDRLILMHNKIKSLIDISFEDKLIFDMWKREFGSLALQCAIEKNIDSKIIENLSNNNLKEILKIPDEDGNTFLHLAVLCHKKLALKIIERLSNADLKEILKIQGLFGNTD